MSLRLLEKMEELSSVLPTYAVSLLILIVLRRTARWGLCRQGKCCGCTEVMRV